MSLQSYTSKKPKTILFSIQKIPFLIAFLLIVLNELFSPMVDTTQEEIIEKSFRI
jgi:hypothetical protein